MMKPNESAHLIRRIEIKYEYIWIVKKKRYSGAVQARVSLSFSLSLSLKQPTIPTRLSHLYFLHRNMTRIRTISRMQ